MKRNKGLLCLLLSLTFTVGTIGLTACQADDPQASLPPSSEEILPPENENPSDTPTDAPTDVPSETPEVKPTPQPTYAKYIRCTGDGVNIRSGASTQYAVLGYAEKYTTYAVIGQTGNWYQTYYRGKTAYIHASYAAVISMEQSDDPTIETVLDEGYKRIGVPYVYGAVRLHDGKGNFLKGFTAQKFDCSSLVQYMFYQGAGKLLQVTTRTQVKQGEFVAKEDIQRGDCLFFTNESRQHLSGVERVGHVAVYLGDNYILHTASDYARIEKISAARWKFYLEARRFI